MSARRARSQRIRRGGRLKFASFCDALMGALDQEHPDWMKEIDVEDLKRWIGERWPIPPEAGLSMHAWARCCYRDLTETASIRLAS